MREINNWLEFAKDDLRMAELALKEKIFSNEEDALEAVSFAKEIIQFVIERIK